MRGPARGWAAAIASLGRNGLAWGAVVLPERCWAPLRRETVAQLEHARGRRMGM